MVEEFPGTQASCHARRRNTSDYLNKPISMEASRAAWRNVVLPGHAGACEGAGSHPGKSKKTSPGGDKMEKRRRKLGTQATTRTSVPPASEAPQGNSGAFAPAYRRPPEEPPTSTQAPRSPTAASLEQSQPAPSRKYSPTTPKHQTTLGSLSGSAQNVSHPRAEVLLASSKSEAQANGARPQ